MLITAWPQFSIYLPVNHTTGMGFGREYGAAAVSVLSGFGDGVVVFDSNNEKQKTTKKRKAVMPKARKILFEFMVAWFYVGLIFSIVLIVGAIDTSRAYQAALGHEPGMVYHMTIICIRDVRHVVKNRF